MNPYQKTIRLVQHTPMIHFQAGQAGATLRATEVKAKFDRFLHEEYPAYLRKEALHSEIPKPAAGQKYSGYQMQIRGKVAAYYVPWAQATKDTVEEVKTALRNRYPQFDQHIPILTGTPYFANADKTKQENGYDLRLAVMYDDVELILTSKKPQLLEYLTEALPHFLVRHNFGTRNTKGFGCFLPAEGARKLLQEATPYSFQSSVSKPEYPFSRVFEDINLLYSALRAGLNLPGNRPFYFKSLLFLYFREKDIQWEKKTIKQTYFLNKDEDHKRQHGTDPDTPIGHETKNKKLVRDLLGLSSSQSWGRDAITKEHLSTGATEKENAANKIDRAPSPLWFKPLRSADGKSFEVFVGTHALSEKYLGKEFQLKANGRGDLKLSLPATFDPDDFLRFAFAKNLQDHVDAVFHSHPHFQTLEAMFEDLNK